MFYTENNENKKIIYIKQRVKSAFYISSGYIKWRLKYLENSNLIYYKSQKSLNFIEWMTGKII